MANPNCIVCDRGLLHSVCVPPTAPLGTPVPAVAQSATVAQDDFTELLEGPRALSERCEVVTVMRMAKVKELLAALDTSRADLAQEQAMHAASERVLAKVRQERDEATRRAEVAEARVAVGDAFQARWDSAADPAKDARLQAALDEARSRLAAAEAALGAEVSGG